MRVFELAGPPPLVRYRLVERRGRRLLVVRFDVLRRRIVRDLFRRPDARTALVESHMRRSLGIHARRLHETLYVARGLDASVYVLWYRGAPNQAIHWLESPEVRVVRPSRARDLLVRVVWWTTSPVLALKRGLGRLDAIPAETGAMREEMMTRRVGVRLREELEAEAREQAAGLGFAEGVRIVTLHVRESGWRPFESADPRSCDISTYREAVDELVRRGFRVVRIGDASMTPIDWPGVLDLATDPARTDLVELWCMLRSVFFLGCDSGPTELAKLVGVPMLIVNVKHPQGQYPLRSSDLFIMKRLVSEQERRILTLREHLGVKSGRFALNGHESYLDNSPDEILQALMEMLDSLEAVPSESAAQAEFRRLASTKLVKGEERVRNLGNGRIARFFADRYLDRSDATTAAGERPG